jgi:Tol biopolymer transport system component
MPLSPGDRLGPYEIVSRIGAGGMGEVWKARDTRLGRDVAVKTSAQQFSERFEREARAIATLNHPNICTLYDVGPNYLVMELIDGPTLAERIKDGALPLSDALAIARQIKDALEAAHEKGIVHRDLKPANIKTTAEGVVKVLDFGLAKATGAPSAISPSDPEHSPTISMAATQAGVILGTAAYMSPEQARGKVVDKRADIWAFGVVLYEMLTGQKLFHGDDLSETMASVIKEKPDLSGVPPQVRRLLERCLEKDPKKRLRDIGDAWDLLDVGQGDALPSPGMSVGRRHALPWAVAAVLGVIAIALGVALWAPWRSEKPVDRPLVRLDVDLGADVSLPDLTNTLQSLAISPDGTRLVYASRKAPSPTTKLFIRRLDQPEATELQVTQGAGFPFFSADGQWLGFVSGNKLNKVSVEGGAVVPLGEAGNFAGASWDDDGSIVVSDALGKGLLRVPAAGGPPAPVAALSNGEIVLANPQILPGGKAILFVAVTTMDPDKNTIEVLTLADRHRKILVRGGNSPRYVASSGQGSSRDGAPNGVGHLVYVNKATMFAIPFDLDKLETRGTAVPVLNDVANQATTGIGQFDLSSAPSGHGTLVYRRASGTASGMSTLQWLDSTLKKEPLRAKPGVYQNLTLSWDGKRVALTVAEGGSSDIWVYDPQRDSMTRLTFGGEAQFGPQWSPDGRYILFASIGKGIFQARADGASQPQALLESKIPQIPGCFSPDGKRLGYTDFANGNPQLWTLPLEDQGGRLKAGKPEQFLKSSFADQGPLFSPDGRWVAYISNESGKNEIYVRPFAPSASLSGSAGQGGKWQISNNGATGVLWSRNGHELVYHSGDQMMAVSYTVKGDTFVAEKPRVLVAKLGPIKDWDLAPDGKRVLVATPVESAEAPKQEHEVVFLENFFDYLRQRVPIGK